jgi:cytosine/creatinine deaminase
MVLDVATHGGARVLGDNHYGLAPGAAADFVLLDGETHVSAVIDRPPRALVVKNGTIVARDGVCLVGEDR